MAIKNTNSLMTDAGGLATPNQAKLVKRAAVNTAPAGSTSKVPALQNTRKQVQAQNQNATKLSTTATPVNTAARKRRFNPTGPGQTIGGQVSNIRKPSAELTPVKPKTSTQKTPDPWKTGW